MGCCISTPARKHNFKHKPINKRLELPAPPKSPTNSSATKLNSGESKDHARNTMPITSRGLKKKELTDVYTVKKVIGNGSFGIVRRGQPIMNPGLTVAIKSIDKLKVKKDMHLLKREVSILQSVDHPNIIKFYEMFDDAKYLHIVMEYCEGGELFEKIMEKGRINEKKAASYMEKILRAVNHLHGMGVCHRDLKPENFLFENDSSEAELKIIDFGLSNKFGNKYHKNLKMETFVGTPYYIAPEVIKGSYDPKCDL